jgi:tetratricopeptide (TPR) repeat protein
MAAFPFSLRQLTPEQVLDLGLRYEKLGEHYAAMPYYHNVVQARPDCAESRYHLALAYYNIGDLDKATEHQAILQTQSPILATQLADLMSKKR